MNLYMTVRLGVGMIKSLDEKYIACKSGLQLTLSICFVVFALC